MKRIETSDDLWDLLSGNNAPKKLIVSRFERDNHMGIWFACICGEYPHSNDLHRVDDIADYPDDTFISCEYCNRKYKVLAYDPMTDLLYLEILGAETTEVVGA